MKTISERFAALPRGRRGTETMIIASEDEVRALLFEAFAHPRVVNYGVRSAFAALASPGGDDD